MSGWPVWLASMSKRNRHGQITCAKHWAKDPMAYDYLCRALHGRGDRTRERLFRMNVTLCLHRAATEEEINGLPQTWKEDLSGIAGGPVEIIWSKGVVVPESCKPCLHPVHAQVIPGRPDLWIPEDCGRCPPCLARKQKQVE
jgi:hypothetical protein